jgi:hypothetical protein
LNQLNKTQGNIMFGLNGMGSLFSMPQMDLTSGMNLLPDTNAVNSFVGTGNMGMGEAMKPTVPTTVPNTGMSSLEKGLNYGMAGTQILGGLGGLYMGNEAVNTMQDQQALAEESYNYQVQQQEEEQEYLSGLNF